MFSRSFRPRSRLKNVALLTAAGSALVFAACSGPSFSPCPSGACEPAEGGEAGMTEPTPSPAGHGGQNAPDGAAGAQDDAGGGGGRDASGGAGEAAGGVPNQGHAGEGASGAGDAAAGETGEPGTPCSKHAQCDNGDPTDGEEQCVDDRCVSGNAPPFVVSVSPDRGAMDRDPDEPITLTFSEKIAPESLTSDSVIVEAGGTPVAGSLSYSGTVATFTPDVRFPLRGLVNVKVLADAVTDLEGAHMLDDFSSAFWIRDGVWTSPMLLDAIAPARAGRRVPVDANGNVLVTFVRSSAMHVEERAFSRFYHPGIGLAAFVEHAQTTTPAAVSITGALNEDGVASVLWRQTAQFAYGCYSRVYRERSWSAEPQARNFEANSIATGVSPTQEVHFALGQALMGFTRCTPDGSCDGVRATPNDGEETFPSFAFDAQGNAIVAWRRVFHATYPGGIVVAHYSAADQAWQPGSLIVNPHEATEPTGSQPALAMAPDGSALLVWVEEGVGTPVTPRLLLASYYTAESGWSEAQLLSTELGNIRPSAPSVAFDGTGFVVAWMAFQTGPQIYTSRFDGHDLVSPERRNGSGAFAREVMPQLASDAAGNLMLTWLEISGENTQRVAYQRRVDGVWSSTEYVGEFENTQVEDTTLDPAFQLGLGATGVGAVLWEEREGTELKALRLAVFE